MKNRKVFHDLKVISAFALLGTVLTGAAFGAFVDFDPRPYGAAIGGGAAALFKLYHLH